MAQAAMITGYDRGYVDIAALTVPIMRSYAKRHGLVFYAEVFTATERAPSWSKIPAIKRALARRYDPVIWIDADALIVRPDLDIQDGADPSKDILVDPFYNAGVMLIRNTPWSDSVLDTVWNNQLVPEHASWDNAAFLYTLGYRRWLGRGEDDCPNEDVRSHIGQLDARWNRLPLVQPSNGAFIRHYAGLPLRARVALIRRDIAIPFYGLIASPASRLAHRVFTFDERMSRKAVAARIPAWYYGRQIAGRILRSLLSPVF